MLAGPQIPIKPASHTLSVAARNAEALFEAKNVAEIRQIEARTRTDIEDKNLQLRQLVGDSYRDLIDGTDKIIDISTKCHSILGSILAIQEGCARLAVSVSATPGSTQDGKESVRKHRELNAVGSRVKYVMDTPEVIWGCLDAGSHLDAARRLLRVQEVHGHLQEAFAPLVASKFPVLSHQWQTVLKFRQHILTGALSVLSSQQDLSSRQAADAIAAVALLEGQDSRVALQAFLAARRQLVQQQLEQAVQGRAGQGPGEVLAALAQTVQTCVAQVGELFTEPPQQPAAASADLPPDSSSGSSSLLKAVLQEDEAEMSELYFGSAEGLAGASSSPEADTWRQRSTVFCQQLAVLQQVQVQEACCSWLSEVSASCSSNGLMLLQQCTDAPSLLQAEAAVHTAMAEWVPTPADLEASAAAAAEAADGSSTTAGAGSRPGTAGSMRQALLSRGDKQQSRLGRLSSASAAASVGTPPGSPGKRGQKTVSAWEVTSAAVLGQKVDLWQVLCHAPFLERCKQTIAAALHKACSSIHEPLAAALEAAAQHDPEPAGQLQPGAWPSITSTGAAADSAAAAGGALEAACSVWGAGSLANAHSGRTLSLVPSGALKDKQGAAAFRNEVQAVLQLFDTQLHAALTAVLLLTAAPAAEQGQHQRQQGAPSRASSLLPTSSNAGVLRGGSLLPATSSAAAGGSGIDAKAASAASAAAAAAVATAGKQRASELEAFAQQCCLKEVQQLAADLQQQLQQLPAAAPGIAGAPVMEQALLLARLCSGLAGQSCMLPAVLGPAEVWPAAAAAGPLVGPPGSGTSGASGSSSLPASIAQGVSALGPAAAALLRMHHPSLASVGSTGQAVSGTAALLASLQQLLHSIACNGYGVWAAWASRSFAGELAAALGSNQLLFSDTTPLAWTETKLSTDAAGADAATAGLLDLLGDASAAAAGDMSFALPACPSGAVMQLLSRACWEVRRAGELVTPADALQLLLWELHGALVTSLAQLVTTSSSSSGSNGTAPAAGAAAGGMEHRALSEKGVLQLLFDQRLIRDVLGGGKPLAAVSAAAAAGGGGSTAQVAAVNGNVAGFSAEADVAARKRLVTGLEHQLQELLDPIDWATYEPHLWSNVQRFYGRTSVLLGVLGQLNKPYGDAARTAPGAAAADINALNVLPVVPRFHYLPISTPSTATLPKQRSSHLSRHASAAVHALARAAGSAGAQPLGAAAVGGGAQQQLPLATISVQASDLAAQLNFADLGSGSSKASAADSGYGAGGAAAAAAAATASFLHPTAADTAAAAGASALSALQAKLQGSSFGAFGSMLGDRAAEVTAMAQSSFGDFLGPAGGVGGLGGLGGGLLSSLARGRGDGSAG